MGMLFHKKKKWKQFQSFHFRFKNLSNIDAIDRFENALPAFERTHRFGRCEFRMYEHDCLTLQFATVSSVTVKNL